MKSAPLNLSQEELALNSVRAHAVFGTRSTVYVHEVSKVLSISIQHVIDLITEYQDTGGKAGLAALNVSNGRSSLECKGQKVPRGCWRIPVSAFDDFVNRAAGVPAASGKTLSNQPTKTTNA